MLTKFEKAAMCVEPNIPGSESQLRITAASEEQYLRDCESTQILVDPLSPPRDQKKKEKEII